MKHQLIRLSSFINNARWLNYKGHCYEIPFHNQLHLLDVAFMNSSHKKIKNNINVKEAMNLQIYFEVNIKLLKMVSSHSLILITENGDNLTGSL